MPVVTSCLLPVFLDPLRLSGATAVIIDVLRATTTMLHALHAGAEAVVPCLSIEETLERSSHAPPELRVLGGERGGRRIPGFDLDNSPYHYTPETVRGKTVYFTTTNGTAALHAARAASSVVLGAFNNVAALVQFLRESDRDVVLVCAGTDGHLTAEDILLAGDVAHALTTNDPRWTLADVPTRMSRDFAVARAQDPARLLETMRNSLGGRNLLELGMDRDIARAARRDLFDLVPQWSAATGRIEPARRVSTTLRRE